MADSTCSEAVLRAARVLLVDDLEADLRLLEDILRAAGFGSVEAARTGAQAVARYREGRHDLVVLDVGLPDIDNFEVLRELRGIEPGYLPVVVATAEPSHLKRALEGGARDFVAKPYSLAEVVLRARNVVETSAAWKDAGRRSALELERTAEALRESEARFRALVEQSVAGIYIVDEWRYAYVNPRLCELLGYEAGELVGRESMQLVHPADRERLAENRARAAAGDLSALVASYRLLRRDGGIVHLAVGGKFAVLRGRRVMIGVAQDLTETVFQEQKRREAETHYTAIVEQSLVGIYIRADERIVYTNPRMREILGRDAAELEKLKLADLVVAEDVPAMEGVLHRRRAGVTGAIRVPMRIRRPDGRLRHVEVETKVIEVGGRRETLGIVQDVTERERAAEALRLSEEKYRLLWETTTDAVILLGEDGIIQYANPSVAHVFGCAPEVLEGQHVRVLQPDRYRTVHEQGMARFLRSGERRLNWRRAEFMALHRDGREFPVEISFSRLSIGGRWLFAAFMRDISERRAALAALEDAYGRMQALSERVLDVQEEERRAISLELHDDVGQSLVALRIGLHRLAADMDPRRAALAAELDELAGKVQERVRELSRELHPPELGELGLAEALRWLAERHQAVTGLEVACAFGAREERRFAPEVESACFRICQEALNNATRHAKARNVRIALELRGRELLLCVADDGVGFDAASGRAHGPQDGSLGLMGMEQRARRAGGRLEVDTSPGKGTRIRASFLVRAPEALAGAA